MTQTIKSISTKHKMTANKLSRLLTTGLRHTPELIGTQVNYNGGWANVKAILAHLNISMDQLEAAVANDPVKKRLSLNTDKTLVRANQGHSIPVDLGLVPVKPPLYLYHGTNVDALPLIKLEGIKKMGRHHVHMAASSNGDVITVGRRNGTPVVIEINALEMHNAGIAFYQSDNGVWLTDFVPVGYFAVMSTNY
jgi:putative RNA 2'-phosphotransferase